MDVPKLFGIAIDRIFPAEAQKSLARKVAKSHELILRDPSCDKNGVSPSDGARIVKVRRGRELYLYRLPGDRAKSSGRDNHVRSLLDLPDLIADHLRQKMP